MWYYLMDPAVGAIEDAKAGIYNSDKWNNEMPASEADLVRFRNCKIYFAVFTLLMTLCLFA